MSRPGGWLWEEASYEMVWSDLRFGMNTPSRGSEVRQADSLYPSDIVSELGLLFPQSGYGFPKTHIPFPRLYDQKNSQDDEKRGDTEIKTTQQELHNYEADRGKCEAGLHIGMHGSLS